MDMFNDVKERILMLEDNKSLKKGKYILLMQKVTAKKVGKYLNLNVCG